MEESKCCQICLVDTSLVTSTKRCKHKASYCKTCIVNTFQANVDKGILKFQCNEPGCKVIVTQDDFMQLVDERHRKIADTILLREYLENENEFRYCSNPKGCGGGQMVTNFKNLQGYYACAYCNISLCFQHKTPYHFGLTCKEFDIELDKNPELRSDFTILQNTKNCPQCKNPIEKAAGCSIMVCCLYGTHQCQYNVEHLKKCDHGGKQFCGQMFCWECLTKFVNGKRQCKPPCKFAE